MKKVKRLLCLLCALCLSLNVLVAGAEDEHIDAGTMMGSSKNPILVVQYGKEDGQVGMGGSELLGYDGPESFVVEQGKVYILDSLNDRVCIYQNGKYINSFPITECPRATLMKYQNDSLYIVDNYSKVTAVYTNTGTLLAKINHPDVMKNDPVASLVGMGDSYVIWHTFDQYDYRYDWETQTLFEENDSYVMSKLDENTVGIMNTAGKVAWQIDAENKSIEFLGQMGDDVVYEQYEYIPDVDIFLAELSVRKRNLDGSESYAIIDTSQWFAPPMNSFYYSLEGKIYLMECLEEYTVISEIHLGTADVSKMAELREKADVRNVQRRLEDSVIEKNSTFTSGYTKSRTAAESRALWMVNFQWTVTGEHKTERPGLENNIRIPKCVRE